MEALFFEIGTVLMLVAGMAVLFHKLKLPVILGYISAGVLIGPSFLGLTRSDDVFEIMSKIGVAFLLFTVGLGLNWRSAKEVGGVAFATGVAQVIGTTVISFGAGIWLGFSVVQSLYVAIALAFASTIIVVKFLTDKEELESLHGRIGIGLLLVQDFLAMMILLVLNATRAGHSVQDIVLFSLAKALLLIPCLWFFSTKVLPPILRRVASSQEVLFLFSIGWCFAVALVLEKIGFGIELGALIAGVTLSGSFYQKEIMTRIRPLRDFFLVIFFLLLGVHFEIGTVQMVLGPIALFSGLVLIGNPLLVLILMRLLGYHPRTGFLTGTTIAQISEFSFIIIGFGIANGDLPESMRALVTAVGLVTIAGSAFWVEYNKRLFDLLHPLLRFLEPSRSLPAELRQAHKPTSVFLFGFHRTGEAMLPVIQSFKQSYTIVDFDPQVIFHLAEAGLPGVYGDVGDEEFLDEIHARHAKLIVSTVPDMSVSTTILTFLSLKSFTGTVIVSVRTPQEAAQCYALGASYVIVPSVLSGTKMAELLTACKMKKTSWSAIKRRIPLPL